MLSCYSTAGLLIEPFREPGGLEGGNPGMGWTVAWIWTSVEQQNQLYAWQQPTKDNRDITCRITGSTWKQLSGCLQNSSRGCSEFPGSKDDRNHLSSYLSCV